MTTTKKPRRPRRHHYIPEVYLKRWIGSDGMLIEFRHRYGGKVGPRSTSPGGTGYVFDLYTAPNEAPDETAKLETQFFSPVDSAAGEALDLLYVDGQAEAWNDDQRSAWSRFILSLLLRTPEDIAFLKSSFSIDWTKTVPEMKPRNPEDWSADDLARYRKTMASVSSEEKDSMALSLAPTLIDHEGIGARLNHMRWRTLQFVDVKRELLTSDRPVVMTGTLTEEHAHIILPIGPSRLFVAVKDDATFEILRKRDPDDLIEVINELVTQHAQKVVFGRDTTQLRFIQNRLGTKRQPSLMERIERMRKHRVDAKN